MQTLSCHTPMWKRGCCSGPTMNQLKLTQKKESELAVLRQSIWQCTNIRSLGADPRAIDTENPAGRQSFSRHKLWNSGCQFPVPCDTWIQDLKLRPIFAFALKEYIVNYCLALCKFVKVAVFLAFSFILFLDLTSLAKANCHISANSEARNGFVSSFEVHSKWC